MTPQDDPSRRFGIPKANSGPLAPRKYTHCEISKLAFFSYTSATIPWLNHNQAPRNT